jgi:trehalose synthase
MEHTLKDYEAVVGPVAISQLTQLGRELAGAKVVHVNSTKSGGGVAEILTWLIPLMRELGIDASWEVIDGNEPYFNTTKAFHNGLQGNPVVLSPAMIDVYESTVRENFERLQSTLEEADFVIIHDPQPAALLNMCPNRRGQWVWRCHIDASRPNRHVWNYLKSNVSGFDASIFSMPNFAQQLPHPQFLIAPSIDPLSDKNCELSESEIRETLDRLDLPPDVPLVTQVSRFDRFKDPVGVIEAFHVVRETCDVELVLAGGDATDDPEGAVVLDEVQAAANGDPHIHILLLPSDSHRAINALQRASSLVIQKSLQEGFGLTVAEAMWKGKPVIGGNVGGIRLQVHNYHTGFLVDSPEGAALRIRELLRQPERIDSMGRIARQFVEDNFLLTRHLREYLTLMVGLRHGLTNYLLMSA